MSGSSHIIFAFRELGTALPKADSQQEAVILMLQKRVEILKEKLGKMENEAAQKLVAGEFIVFGPWPLYGMFSL